MTAVVCLYIYIRIYNSSSLSSSRLWTIVPFHRIHPWFRVRDGRGRTAVRSNSTCLNNYSLRVVRRGGERGWARAKNKINRRRSGGWLHDYRGNSLKRNELYRDVGRVPTFFTSPLFLFLLLLFSLFLRWNMLGRRNGEKFVQFIVWTSFLENTETVNSMTLCFFGLINEEWIFKNGQWISRDENKEEIPEGTRVGIQRLFIDL